MSNRCPLGVRLLAVLGASASLAFALPARAESDGFPAEPALPKGLGGPLRACSFRHPVCVQGDRGAPVLEALADAETTWDAAVGPMGLPAPDPDLSTGVYDVVLAHDAESAGITYLRERDPLGHVDRASAVSVLDATLRGCSLERAVARELFRAIAFRAAPGQDETNARAQASALVRLTVPCALGAPDGVELLQAHPERAVVSGPVRVPDAYGRRWAEGAGLFYSWLDDAYGQRPGAIVRGIWALSSTRSARGQARFVGEPDGFDVLRESFKGALGSGSTLDDVFVEFSVARALTGGLDDAPELAVFAPAVLAYDLPWPTEPHRVASSAGIAPSGADYVRVSRRGAAPGTRLRVEITWEEHARMRWIAVKLDAQGRAMARIPIGSADKAVEAQLTVAELDDTSSVLLVGANVGNWTAPFDPDVGELEPHGWAVTVATQ